MGFVMTKSVLRVSDNMIFKPVSSATETSYKIKILLVASLDMIIFNTLIKKVLIRLSGGAGLSAPLLFTNTETGFLTSRPTNKT